MAEEVHDEFYQRYQNYVGLVCRRICAPILDQDKVEKIVRDVLRKMREKAHAFTSGTASPKKLSRRLCIWLEVTLCDALLAEKELEDKDLLGLIAKRDESHIAKVAAGRAHDELYHRHHRDLLKVCRRGTRDVLSEAGVEDVVQEVFTTVYEKAYQFKAADKNIGDPEKLHKQVHTWLSKIALNGIRDILRKRTKLKIINAGDIEIKEAGEIGDEEKLDRIRCGKNNEKVADLMNAAENTFYPPDETPEIESKREKIERLAKEAAHKVLSERELDIFLASLDWYSDDEERQRALKERENKYGITTENRRQIQRRSRKKVEKYMKSQGKSEK